MAARQQPETSSLTPAMVELLAAAGRATSAIETWSAVDSAQIPQARTDGLLAAIPAVPDAQRLLDDRVPEPAGRSGTAPTGDAAATKDSTTSAADPLALPAVSVFEGLADVIDNTYNAVETPIRTLVEAIEDGLTLIGVPVFLASQGTIFYTFGEAVVKSVLFNTTDWLRGEGDFAANLEDLGTDLLAAGVWLTIDELTAFNLLPPTPIVLPRPPIDQDDERLTMSGEETETDDAARSGVSVDGDEDEPAGGADTDIVLDDTQTVDDMGAAELEGGPVDEGDPSTGPVGETDASDETADVEADSDHPDTDTDVPDRDDNSGYDQNDADKPDDDRAGDDKAPDDKAGDDTDDSPKETSNDDDGSGSDTD